MSNISIVVKDSPNIRQNKYEHAIPSAEMDEFEIVGLLGDGNGRSCERHAVCGVSVEVGDILRTKECVVN